MSRSRHPLWRPAGDQDLGCGVGASPYTTRAKLIVPRRRVPLLTEATVEKSFRKLFSTPTQDEATFEKAEELLDELRPESPLRHRLSQELDELRDLSQA